MITLRQLIHYPDTNSVEATWVDVITPAIYVPESTALDTLDEAGNVVPGEVIPAHTIPAVEIPVRCHSYADVQMDMLEADLGIDLPAHAALIATVRANIQPIPVPTLPEWQEKLKQSVTEKRTLIENGGTTIAGIPIATDQQSQARLTGALSFTGRNPNRKISWKTSSGQFVQLTKAQIEGLVDGAGEFIAKCFDNEAAHYAAIDTLTTVATYDINTGWPT